MSEFIAGIIIVGILLLLLGSGVMIAVAMGVTAVLALHFLVGAGMESYIALAAWLNIASFILTPIPLFLFMGEILFHSRVSQEIFAAGSAWFGRFPGSLFHSNIVACTLFAACSGSSVATAATIGTVAIPELEKRGFDKRMLFGSLAGGGTLGLLIPPSISLIIYGAIVGESVGKLFIGGIIPGLVLSGTFMSYIVFRCLRNRRLAPLAEKTSWRDKFLHIKKLWVLGVLIFVVLGSIYLGIATPTESAALGVSIALFFCLMRRKLTWQVLRLSLFASVRTTSMLMFIVMGAMLLSFAVANLRIPGLIAEWIFSLTITPLVVLILISLLYVTLGCFFEGISMMVLMLPVVFPVITELGYDPIWFGIYLTVLIEMAQITPPVGLNLYVLHGIRPDYPITEIIKGAAPYVFLMIIGMAILIAFPILVLWLPNTMM